MNHLSTVRSSQKQHQKSQLAHRLFTTTFTRAKSLLAKVKFVKQIANERHTLRHLSDHQLRDIGMTRDQIGTEINRSILDLPHARFNELDYRFERKRPRQTRVSKTPKD